MRMRCLLVFVCPLAACGRFAPEEVVPSVVHASIVVDRARAADPAEIAVSLLVHGTDDTDADAELTHAELIEWRGDESELAAPLRLAFPTGFDRHLRGAECRPVDLANVGTLNEDLFHWCDAALDLQVWTRPAADRGVARSNAPYTVTVDCK